MLVSKYAIPTLESSQLFTLDLSDAKKFPSVGAILGYNPEYDSGLIVVHKSFVIETYDGTSYEENNVGETFDLYTFSLKKKQVRKIKTLVNKRWRGQIPNAFLHMRPGHNQILLEILSHTLFLIDLNSGKVDEIVIDFTNPESLNLLGRWGYPYYRKGQTTTKLEAIHVIDYPGVVQWSKDGRKLGAKLGGFCIIDFQ